MCFPLFVSKEGVAESARPSTHAVGRFILQEQCSASMPGLRSAGPVDHVELPPPRRSPGAGADADDSSDDDQDDSHANVQQPLQSTNNSAAASSKASPRPGLRSAGPVHGEGAGSPFVYRSPCDPGSCGEEGSDDSDSDGEDCEAAAAAARKQKVMLAVQRLLCHSVIKNDSNFKLSKVHVGGKLAGFSITAADIDMSSDSRRSSVKLQEMDARGADDVLVELECDGLLTCLDGSDEWCVPDAQLVAEEIGELVHQVPPVTRTPAGKPNSPAEGASGGGGASTSQPTEQQSRFHRHRRRLHRGFVFASQLAINIRATGHRRQVLHHGVGSWSVYVRGWASDPLQGAIPDAEV